MAEYRYKSPRERDEERYEKHRKEENRKLVVGLVIFAVATVASVFWGVWWFNNCAFRAYYDAPMICHANTSQR